MRLQRVAPGIHFTALYTPEQQAKYMDEASKQCALSECKRAHTGAIVVSKDNEIVGRGHNVIPEGLAPCNTYSEIGCVREEYTIPHYGLYDKTCQAIHAEDVAITKAGYNKTKGGTLFLSGHYDLCGGCKLKTIFAGIEDVYIQFVKTEPIKHFSRKELIAKANELFAAQLKDFLKTLKK